MHAARLAEHLNPQSVVLVSVQYVSTSKSMTEDSEGSRGCKLFQEV